MHTSSSFISSNSSVNWSRTSSQVLSEHSDGIAAVSISEEGNCIASCAGGVVRIWDTDEAKLIGEIGESTDMFYAVGISLDGSKVAAAGINKKVLLWDVESGQLEQTLKGHEYWIQSVAFSSSGSKLVSACEKSVRIWNVKTGEVFRVLEDTATGIRVPLFSEVYSARPVAFSPDGIHVAAGGTDKLVKVWNILNRYGALVLKGHTDRIASATFSLDGKLLLSGSWDGTIKAWNWRVSDLPILTLSSSTTPRAIAISPDGNLVASTSKKNVSLWSTNKKEVVAKLEGHTRDVECIAFLPDGNGLVSGSEDKTLRIWRAQVNQSSPLSPYPSPITGSRGITGDPGPSSARTVERWNQFVPLNKQFTGEYRRSTTEPRAHGGFSSVWICDAMLTDNTMQNVALKELRVRSTRIASDNSEDLNNSLLKVGVLSDMLCRSGVDT
ncbi:hypothetical protein FRC03_001145 [Tulasnella sp. 419]|nr:hypothetical protein FRC03_001145 [Tulasnella sp. 419]